MGRGKQTPTSAGVGIKKLSARDACDPHFPDTLAFGMKLLSETLPGRALGLLAAAVTRHRWLFLWPQFLLFGLCVVYTWSHLKIDTDRNNLVGSDKAYNKLFLAYNKEFPSQDDLVVVVESENMEKNRQFVERLGRKLEAETNIFTDVFYKGDLQMI